MKALCLHLPTIALNATFPMVKEYLSRNDLKKLGQDMLNSADPEVQIEWGNFCKVDAEKTQGGVITGLKPNNYFRPLTSLNWLFYRNVLSALEGASIVSRQTRRWRFY